MTTRKPKTYDIEMQFKWGDQMRYVLVNVKECPVCSGFEIFLTACQVCGRFSPKDRAIYFQPARSAYLTSVERDANLDGITERKPTEAEVARISPRGGSGDDGPKAS